MYREYKDRAEFFLVYVREAHASDIWQTGANIKENIIISTPRSYLEKVNAAALCAAHLCNEIPTLVDDFDNSTERNYHGWPDRIYVIDRSGCIAYKGKTGPFGFKQREAEDILWLITAEPPETGSDCPGNPGEEVQRLAGR